LIGGIIALGLATKDLSTTRLKAEFLALATKTFEKRREGTLMTMLDPFKVTSTFFLLLRIWESVYRTSPLKDGLKRLFGSDQNLFSAARRPVRVAVTSVKDNGADKCLITNYNRPLFGTDHDFEREDESQKDMKIWEAGLATAAAPFYFRKYEKPETKKNYTDGALHANFPVPYALEEIARVWARSDDEKVPLDILLSVGTGIQNKEIAIPMPLKIGGFQEICTSFHNSLNSQKGWEEFERSRSSDSDVQGRVHRLNAQIEGTYVALDHYKRMKEIDASVAVQVKDPMFSSHLRKIADLLVANLFFFEPDVNVREIISQGQTEQLSGTIRCRLARDSYNLKNLVDAIESFWYKELRNIDKFPEEKSQWMAVPLSVQQRNGIKTQGHWLRLECKLAPMEPRESQQILAITLRRTLSEAKSGFPAVPIPISGFPINFYCLKKKSK
jgi:predicted acylesterase/phospholipase RssA